MKRVKELRTVKDGEARRIHIYRTIGENVKKLRKTHGLSQLELALAIGCSSVSLVSQAEIYLYGKHFNLEHLDAIARALSVDIRDFFEGI
ncbi:hypothetical protein FACS1894103_5100 [Campylobacterota bacterium]|nr:hypothetical protein FACS1894103_5100 [Campylobacterota bacterium]